MGCGASTKAHTGDPYKVDLANSECKDYSTEKAKTSLKNGPACEDLGPAFGQGGCANQDLDGHGQIRILLIRHAQSGNKEAWVAADGAALDPPISRLGTDQAKRLGTQLGHELSGLPPGGVVVVSSPMRRCLLTIMPTVQALKLPREDCICHGAAFEHGCAGVSAPGSTSAELEKEFPFRCEGFGRTGWDYQGDSPKETDTETQQRMARFAAWCRKEALPMLQSRCSLGRRYLILCMHQTVMDLLLQILVDGTDEHWTYGTVKYKFRNTGVTELSVSADGAMSIIRQNDGSHLMVQPMLS